MTRNTSPAQRILGTLRSDDGVGVVHIEDRYDTDIEDLWQAITDPERVARWYGRIEGDLEQGGDFRLTMDSNGWDGTGHVDACDPPRHLRITTREFDESYEAGIGVPPFDETIEATLSAEGDRTLLVLDIKGMPVDKVQFYGTGWQIHAENLALHVAGREVGDDEARWNELVPVYQEMATRVRESTSREETES